MIQLIVFACIYGVMLFIWSFVYLNKSADQINQAFLYFLTVILVWMVLSVSNDYSDQSLFGLSIKTLYWISMMNMSVFFLYFIYRLIKRELDRLFYSMVAMNTLTILARYCFPMDYADPTFWRLSLPVVAPLMSAIFSIPAIVALYLVLGKFFTAKETRDRIQLAYFLGGITLALVVSVFSEYLLPTVFHVNTNLYLMHVAILIFVVFTVVSIMKYRFLNIQSDYIFQKIFLNASDGIIIINKKQRVVCVNHMARTILGDEGMDSGDRITDYIADYNFAIDYKQHEVVLQQAERSVYLNVTQYPIDTATADSAKLLIITDVTSEKLTLQREKRLLMEKTAIDHLTGLYSKQYFQDKYCTDSQQPNRQGLSLLFIDVDNFKAINDHHGHMVGDQVLSRLAQSMKSNLREDTEVIRFGGDEFIVIMLGTKLDVAYRVAERIRKHAQEVDYSDLAAGLAISLSIGLIEGHAPINDLLMKADMAMYRSKSKGKNATTIFYDQREESIYHLKVQPGINALTGELGPAD
ncbi:MAG: GGDEF domain-containing protein [Candidatus Limiplasma sp.]|nr:GGDEF domain-containing protein [Candidatus Limiplasma sp.]MEA5145842.1 GGDEF domain-containing protein [Candidatus Limiplasma sp.]